MDGNYRGLTPLTLTTVSAGKHTIELDLAGYYDWTSSLSVSPGVTSSINARLSPIPSETPGAIDVVSYPAGADIFLDEKYQGRTPSAGVYTISNVHPGTHTLRASLSGYQDYTTSVVVSAATTSHVTATLQPGQSTTTGSISVTSSPGGAQVYIDNVYRGVTPLTLDGIPTGTHQVRLALAGYNDYSTTVELGAGSTSSVSASLSPIQTPGTGTAPFAAMGALALIVFLVALRRRD